MEDRFPSMEQDLEIQDHGLNAVNVPDTHPTCDHTVHDAVTDCPDSCHPSLVSMITVMIGTFSSFLTLVYKIHIIQMSSSAYLY